MHTSTPSTSKYVCITQSHLPPWMTIDVSSAFGCQWAVKVVQAGKGCRESTVSARGMEYPRLYVSPNVKFVGSTCALMHAKAGRQTPILVITG